MVLRCVGDPRQRIGAFAGLIAVSACLVVAVSSPAEAGRRRHHKRGGYNPPYAAMVVDVKTGRTLYAKNEDAPRHPASITKVMTLYLLFEQLERGRIALGTRLRVSAEAARQAPSKLGLRPGDTIEVEDAIKALVTKSANDVAVVIAENLAGSEEAFAEQMTRKARALGMSETIYRNASGLPDPEQVTTARDLTILGRAIQDRFPRYYRYFQTRSFKYAGRKMSNHNRLLGRVEGVDGIKTGYTRASGFNLLTNVKTDDRHIVAVVVGGRSGAVRDRTMASLVKSHLPRAYAGARTAPMVAEAPDRARPAVVAEATRSRTPEPQPAPAVTETRAAPSRRPSDLGTMRPVLASAATPSTLGWRVGTPPANAHAYAPQPEAVAPPLPPPHPVASASAKIQARLPAFEPIAVARVVEAPMPEPRPELVTTPSPWVIQLGATEDESKALAILEEARSRSGRILAHAAPFTEKIVRDGATLYRARFSGFGEADAAQQACRSLKRSGFACFATRS